MATEKNPKKISGTDFEKSLQKLEDTVQKLESGELTLEESLKAFEEGVSLARSCQETLKSAEEKVEILSRIDPEKGPETEPFQK